MRCQLLACVLGVSTSLFLSIASAQPGGGDKGNWAETVKLPVSEKSIKLFNGKDLDGWEGQIEKYWSVDNGTIKATNTALVPVSTYLFTKKHYRDFRLLLEIKQTVGKGYATIHSAVACLGEKFMDKGDPYSFKGPLLMLCNDWGYYDVNGRKRVAPPNIKGNFKFPGEKVGNWNRIEILVLGNRLRYAANGQLVIDFTDQPDKLKAAPIGLQLHQNKDKEEYHFRGLVLTEKPEDRLVTVGS